ncbi:MAG: hypothetical protein KDB65_06590 [Calditrichaeota bacterium]|nr:hypothetical protein [Calditrichota bacterium]MCB9369739.1 hypothetical protein [Calditrichota bacterium]
MKANTPILKIVAMSALIVFAIGCSEFNAPTASQSTESEISNSQYMPIEQAIANVEAMGYRVITPKANALDDQDCDSIITTRSARVGNGLNINISGVCKLTIPGSSLPYDMDVTVVAPSSCMGVADFYPHPTQFAGNITIRWDARDMVLPEGVSFQDITPLYIHDDGTPEEVVFERSDNRFITVTTNHFSRYIITSRLLF